MAAQWLLSLAENDVMVLREALLYLDVAMLRTICNRFRLPLLGKKGVLIGRIAHFVSTRQIVEIPPYPEISCARHNVAYPLELDTFMLYGSFKTDDATRRFLRRFIGKYFHFTSFCHDWLCARWYSGTPPTYREFIQFWEYEFQRRERGKKTKNQDWAYVRFVQNYTYVYPDVHAPTELASAWSELKSKKIKIAFSSVDKVM